MKRRYLLIMAVAAMAFSGLAMASAQDRVIQMLNQQGYSQIQISRTLLGRIRIIAISPTAMREIIVNRRTGEVLRDFLELIGGNGINASGLFDPEDFDMELLESQDDIDDASDDNRGSGSGDNDDDDDGDDGDDDDKSGHGD